MNKSFVVSNSDLIQTEGQVCVCRSKLFDSIAANHPVRSTSHNAQSIQISQKQDGRNVYVIMKTV